MVGPDRKGMRPPAGSLVGVGVLGAVLVLLLSSCGRAEDELKPEPYVMQLFKGDRTPDADARRIITMLPELDWSVYEKESGGGAMKLLDWLEARRIDSVTDIACVLRGTTGLDGAFSEKYSVVVGGLLSTDPGRFVKALGTLSEDRADRIVSFIGYYFSYEGRGRASVKERLGSLLDSPGLTAREKELTGELVRAMK